MPVLVSVLKESGMLLQGIGKLPQRQVSDVRAVVVYPDVQDQADVLTLF